MVHRWALLIFIALLFSACQTVSDVGDSPAEPEPVEPETAVTKPQPPGDGPEVAETEKEEPPQKAEIPTVPIEVPEEVYNRAFEEVEAVINELNEIIQRGDYEAWRDYLTQDYIDYHSHPSVLSSLSDRPVLAQNGVELRNLRDYFQHVVRPSRARARLDSLVFYSDTLVEAVSVFLGQSVIFYVLQKTDGQWKIDTFEVPPAETNS